MALLHDEEFYDLFHGADEVYGSGKAYELSVNWVLSGKTKKEIARRLATCVIVAEKPKKYLMEGASGDKKDKSKAVSTRICSYLPHHADELEASVKEKRSTWPKEWQDVNFAAVRNIAFVYLEAQSRKGGNMITEQARQWIGHYGGGPKQLASRLEEFIPNVESETYKIRKLQLTQFANNQKHWEPMVQKLVDWISEVREKDVGSEAS